MIGGMSGTLNSVQQFILFYLPISIIDLYKIVKVFYLKKGEITGKENLRFELFIKPTRKALERELLGGGPCLLFTCGC